MGRHIRNIRCLLSVCAILLTAPLIFSCCTKRNDKPEVERPDKYYYSQLDDEQKNFYNRLLSMPMGESSIIVKLKTPLKFESKTSEPDESEKQALMDEVQRIAQGAIDAFSTDNPEIFWIDFSRSYTNVEFSGKGNKSGYQWIVKEIRFNISIKEQFSENLSAAAERLNGVISEFAPEGETIYEKVQYIHDYICKTNTSDTGAENQYSIYGALVDGRSVCQGYAQAFKALCDRSGITCICVVGTAQGENHMWNYVRMEDGLWYAIDTTWDDRTPVRYTYFLVGSDTITDSDKNKTFSETHISTGDISRTGIIEFSLPTLSPTAYMP